MGGSFIEDDWDLHPLPNGSRTVLLVGSVGNGKSATGNTIIGRKVFKSRASAASVTSTTEMQSTTLKDGQVINVIDTVGLFDSSRKYGDICKEIVKCIDLAKDGIHAILLVLSVRKRFTEDEATILQTLQTLFGPKITDYMIIVFTGGDELEENDETLDDFLDTGCPEQLQKLLKVCKDRCILFNNKTKSEAVSENQTQRLLDLIEVVMQENEWRPYTDSIFKELKKGAMKLHQQEIEADSLQGYSKQEVSEFKEMMQRSHKEQLERITLMVESKLHDANKRLLDTTKKLEEQLAKEQAARLEAEKIALTAQGKSNDEIQKSKDEIQKSKDEIRKLRENLERAQRETEEVRKAAESGKCSIL